MRHSRRLSQISFLALVFLALVVSGCSNVTVHVQNDTGTYVRIAHCVDDSADFAPGDTFDVGGVPDEGDLLCRVARGETPGQCVAIPHAAAIHNTFPLSRAVTVPIARCD